MFEKNKPHLPKESFLMDCEHCVCFVYDEKEDTDFCNLSLDEDEELRFLTSKSRYCPYFRLYDEYKTVRKQN